LLAFKSLAIRNTNIFDFMLGGWCNLTEVDERACCVSLKHLRLLQIHVSNLSLSLQETKRFLLLFVLR